MDIETLKEYARLMVRIGANVQSGQEVLIYADVRDAHFANLVAEEAYHAGAIRVCMEWDCEEFTKLSYTHQTVETLSEIPLWAEEKMKWRAEHLPAAIHIMSRDPDGLKGVDPEKFFTVSRRKAPTLKKYRDLLNNKYQWTLAGIPGKAWAKKVFPHLEEQRAVDSLWDAILDVTRVRGDAVKNWEEHNADLQQRVNWLNSLNIKTLHYTSENGTDFTIEIDERLDFMAGGEYTPEGIYYMPNMPTEECFTSPTKDSANGVVMATKPLSLYGFLLDRFGFRFENGKVTEILAQNAETRSALEKLLSTDEGSCRLGEVALVPFSSPVNRSGLLFYNSLYDENACCHLALGRGFTECIHGYRQMTEEEIKAVGVNESFTHEDFMIGSPDLNITATTHSGETIPIFRNGTWA